MARLKNLYIGSFNFRRELYIQRCYAYSSKQAWLLFCGRLAKKQGVSNKMVMGLFDGRKDNFNINLEVEFEEE